MSSNPTGQKASQRAVNDVRFMAQRFDEVWRNIARRVHELFGGTVGIPSPDPDDSPAGKRELFSRVTVEISEQDNQLIVRADVSGFEKDELQICVEGNRLLIKGEHGESRQEKESHAPHFACGAKQIFCSVPLPKEVEANTASTTINDGVLEISLTKVS